MNQREKLEVELPDAKMDLIAERAMQRLGARVTRLCHVPDARIEGERDCYAGRRHLGRVARCSIQMVNMSMA
jgi:hypothetical protein